MIDTEKYAWCLRTCKSDGTSYKGFKWPSDIGSIVKCDDWNARPVCGGGLHGLLDGYGNFNLLSDDLNAIWQIVEVERNKCIEIDGKVKFPECKLIATGDMATIMTAMSDYQINLMINDVNNYESQLSTSGDESQLSASGYGSQLAASGDESRLAASGYGSKLAASGYESRLSTSGYESQLSASGDGSQLAASGDGSRLAASGDGSRLAASGYESRLAASGYESRLAASGDGSRLAASGDGSIVVSSGLSSIAKAGENGCIALAYYDDKSCRYRLKVGYVGEEDIKPNVFYKINENYELEEV